MCSVEILAIIMKEHSAKDKDATTRFALTSPAWGDGGFIPPEYTCDGFGESPELLISNTPPGTSSLVLIMHDPDVPRAIRPDGNFDHWVIYDIDPKVTHIPRNASVGTEGLNSVCKVGYVGPCPPNGEHRYLFDLYALDRKLDLGARATRHEVECAMKAATVLGAATLLGRYRRGR